jgi:hypothetical protein
VSVAPGAAVPKTSCERVRSLMVDQADMDLPSDGWSRRLSRISMIVQKRDKPSRGCTAAPSANVARQAERVEARAARIDKLRGLLNSGPPRLHPRPGRVPDRRGPLEMSFRRALVAARCDTLR